ncbi:MAG: hypothetical protein AAFR47_11765 [Pseudomonadota bacterium]
MRHAILAALLMSGVAGAALAENGHDAASVLTDSLAVAFDQNRDGYLSRDELLAGGQAVFNSMDADGSGDLLTSEVVEWEHGFGDIAAFRGREAAYHGVVAFLYGLIDTDRDGAVSMSEHAALIERSIEMADVNGDGALSSTEYDEGFFVNAIIKRSLEG